MTNKRKGAYTPEENRATVALYFTMLDRVRDGRDYSKAAFIRLARGEAKVGDVTQSELPEVAGFCGALACRSKQSIEFKLMNCTAAHVDIINDGVLNGDKSAMGETMHSHGYRGMANYQASLKDAMKAELARRTDRDAREYIYEVTQS